ncbi:MAG: transposase, partial [Dermatophilaceae bacterium]
DKVLERVPLWGDAVLVLSSAATGGMRRSSSTRSWSEVIGRAGPCLSCNQPFYAAIGVDLNGRRDVLGLWAGHGSGESAKFWMSVLTEIKNRCVADVFFIVCDGLKGLPESANTVFKHANVQACVIHLIRATFRYASRKYWDQLARDMKAIYTAANAEAAWAAFEELERGPLWGEVGQTVPRHPEPVAGRVAGPMLCMGGVHPPFLGYDEEIRRVLFSTNAIESLNARYRRAITVRGHFLTEQAALKTLYLVTRGMDPKGTGQARWITRWKPALTPSPSPSQTACPRPRPSRNKMPETPNIGESRSASMGRSQWARRVQAIHVM